MLDLASIFDVDDPPLSRRAPPCSATELPVQWWLMWDERAAIKEFHGGMLREQAEAQALAEVIGMMQEEKNQGGLDRTPR